MTPRERKTFMDGRNRSAIKPGLRVNIVLKKDQRSGALTQGVVKDILTKSPTHTHGIKVRLTDGAVGRVKEILS
jgi:uncharacterized repeat protein (TIGR03833 family)